VERRICLKYAHLFGLEQNLIGRISANIPAAKLIAVSTGPVLTSLAGRLYTMHYCRPKGGVRQYWVMKVDEDCSLHMLVTAPLPKFIDSSVKEHRRRAMGESASRHYEQLNKKEIQRVICIAYHDYPQKDVLGVTWLLTVGGANQDAVFVARA
jgi:hypothetical protein